MVYQRDQKHRYRCTGTFIGAPIKIRRCDDKIYRWTDNITYPPAIISVDRLYYRYSDIGAPTNFYRFTDKKNTGAPVSVILAPLVHHSYDSRGAFSFSDLLNTTSQRKWMLLS